MKTILAAALLGGLGFAFAPQAEAAGCISGAAIGGVAGHVAGHHGLLGAAAGCAIGHHEANVQRRRESQQYSYRNGSDADMYGRDAYRDDQQR